jgi:hypothetical protein
LSIRSHFRNRYLSFYWKKWFYIWCVALTWWLVPCLPFPGLPHIYFLFTARLRIFHVCRNENFRNRYLSFYWKKWFYIWYVALAWWLVPCLHFPGLPHIYFLFTVRLTNERVGVFLARRSVQHLVEHYRIVYLVFVGEFKKNLASTCFSPLAILPSVWKKWFPTLRCISGITFRNTQIQKKGKTNNFKSCGYKKTKGPELNIMAVSIKTYCLSVKKFPLSNNSMPTK